uniref:hypothetical protein n=1 Tax=Butyrivibrio sp. LC3010 TaxID=1280680 RepID=UPI0005D1A38C
MSGNKSRIISFILSIAMIIGVLSTDSLTARAEYAGEYNFYINWSNANNNIRDGQSTVYISNDGGKKKYTFLRNPRDPEFNNKLESVFLTDNREQVFDLGKDFDGYKISKITLDISDREGGEWKTDENGYCFWNPTTYKSDDKFVNIRLHNDISLDDFANNSCKQLFKDQVADGNNQIILKPDFAGNFRYISFMPSDKQHGKYYFSVNKITVTEKVNTNQQPPEYNGPNRGSNTILLYGSDLEFHNLDDNDNSLNNNPHRTRIYEQNSYPKWPINNGILAFQRDYQNVLSALPNNMEIDLSKLISINVEVPYKTNDLLLTIKLFDENKKEIFAQYNNNGSSSYVVSPSAKKAKYFGVMSNVGDFGGNYFLDIKTAQIGYVAFELADSSNPLLVEDEKLKAIRDAEDASAEARVVPDEEHIKTANDKYNIAKKEPFYANDKELEKARNDITVAEKIKRANDEAQNAYDNPSVVSIKNADGKIGDAVQAGATGNELNTANSYITLARNKLSIMAAVAEAEKAANAAYDTPSADLIETAEGKIGEVSKKIKEAAIDGITDSVLDKARGYIESAKTRAAKAAAIKAAIDAAAQALSTLKTEDIEAAEAKVAEAKRKPFNASDEELATATTNIAFAKKKQAIAEANTAAEKALGEPTEANIKAAYDAYNAAINAEVEEEDLQTAKEKIQNAET